MNREENEIRRLFRELRREDERLAPPFAGDWNAALSRTDRGRTPRRTLRLSAAAATALIVLGGLALVVFRTPSKPTPDAAQGSVAARVQTQAPPVVSTEAPTSRVEKSEAGRNREAEPGAKIGSARGLSKNIRRRVPPRSRPAVTLISRWRSPTEFLLNSPGEQLLRTVPRLDESLLKIKTVTLDGND